MAAGSQHRFRFALSLAVGADEAQRRAQLLQKYLARTVGHESDVEVASSYAELAREVTSGKVDAAWAPPFVCARIENTGGRVILRGVRRGVSTYRAALMGRRDAGLTLDRLGGKCAAWTDRNSVAGYLLAMALVRDRGLDPARVFSHQEFVGSYRAALEAVMTRRADLTSIFAAAQGAGGLQGTGVQEIAPEWAPELAVVAFTPESPNDGIALAPTVPPELAYVIERALAAMPSSSEGLQVLRTTFGGAEGFEPAPPMGYRALYKVALASM